MLQAASNARSAATAWENASNRELTRMNDAAQAWLADMTARREKRIESLKARTADLMNELRTELATKQAELRNHVQQRTTSLQNEWARQTEAAEATRVAAVKRFLADRTAELKAAIESINRDREQFLSQLNEDLTGLLANWQSALSDAQSIATENRHLADGLTRWPVLKGSPWQPPRQLPASLTVGKILCSLPVPPSDVELHEQNNLCTELPAVLRFPRETSICIEHNADGREAAMQFVRSTLLRLLTTIPPGRVQFTLIDPIGLGRASPP